MSNQARSLSSWILRCISVSTADRPIRKNPDVTLTASPASGDPRVCSACFIRMPGTLEMPPNGKSAGRLNMISMVWLAGIALSASHTIEIMFNLPADFPFGGISNVPGILMKQAEQTRGAPLSGLAVKVTAGFFLIGLSAVDTEMQRNIQLLKERAWFDIPVVY